MVNYNNYYKYLIHTTFDPNFYYRDYESELQKKESEHSEKEKSVLSFERGLPLVLPFLSLYKPLGPAIFYSMGTYDCISHFSGAVAAGTKCDWKECAIQVGETAFDVLALSASVFHFRTGLLLVTGKVITQKGFFTFHALYHRKYPLALERCLETSTSVFYLGMMMRGTLEMDLIMRLLQAVTNFCQAYKEFAHGCRRRPETIAKTFLGMIRLYQGHHIRQSIQLRNTLLMIQKYRELSRRVQRGKEVRELLKIPLINLNNQIQEKQVILSDAENKEYNLGAHFHGYGKQLVKGANLIFENKMIDGRPVIELSFKVNHVFREEMQKLLEEIQGMGRQESGQILHFFGSHATNIEVTKELFPLEIASHSILNVLFDRITFKGLGTIQFGSTYESPQKFDVTCFNLYDRVVVRIDADKTIFDMYELLSLFNLHETLASSTLEDQEIHKLFFLYHMFVPSKGTPFEREKISWSLSSEELKKTIIHESPEMEKVFETYLSNMGEYDILPGRTRYQVLGVADEIHAEGGRALVAAITGTTSKKLYVRAATLLKMGMLSSEMRFLFGINTSGIGSYSDFLRGGADSVFTQMITERDQKGNRDLNDFRYRSPIRLLFSLELLETNTYQYPYDSHGHRMINNGGSYCSYLKRPNIFQLVRDDVMQSPLKMYKGAGHEIMIKERIPPQFIKGAIVQDQETADAFLHYLRSVEGIVKKDEVGRESILGISIERFFKIGTRIDEKMLS